MSSLTWLDHSEADRKRALDFVDTFREAGTVDELGIGIVRDAFSDLLFPGTSTLQTRARYFLFVPWCYLRLERYAASAKRSDEDVARRARNIEAELMVALKSGDDNEGMLGRDAGAALKQLPSQIYWQGLSHWGIRAYGGTRSQLHRDLARRVAWGRVAEMADVDEVTLSSRHRVWHDGLPPEPEGFLSSVGFSLPSGEASYLRDRAMARVPGTMLAHMVSAEVGLECSTAPWEYPGLSELPPRMREQVRQARIFAVTMWGSALLYNLILAEKRATLLGASEEPVSRYRAELERWDRELDLIGSDLESWRPSHLWAQVADRTARAPRTRAFVQAWFDLAAREGSRVADNAGARQLVSQRERALKANLSRIHNLHALELWSGASGTELITYRWSTVAGLVGDIAEGLRRS